MTKGHVLLLGQVALAQSEWTALAEFAKLSIDDSNSKAELIENFKGKYSDVNVIYHMNGSKSAFHIDEEVIDAFPDSVKFIAHNGAGYDMINANALIKRGVKLSNTPGSVDDATADVNFFLILGALRGFNLALNNLRQGNWTNGLPLTHDPEGKVLGILGLGGIGRAVKRRADAFDITTQYHNRKPLSDELAGGAKYVSFDELLATSDIISLNLPLNAHTRHIINKEAIAKMKDGVVIVNTARGAVIDEAALVEALESGKVASVGLDVFEQEPKIHPGLLNNKNVILLPHVGTRTFETQKKMEIQVLDNVKSALINNKLLNIVPEHAHLV
ncbi:D-isomer specific 2-hydroxyacid dehydrogenase [Lipomyces japonicus]|uniref:D-isomer specific 2-hydroxyacid dehydrogenase n=1 Tax=Lipomyces japonicus TaxID=56871 RepID=UPI0034CD6673